MSGKTFVPKILTVVGARPQFIKAAVVSRAIRRVENFQLNEIIVHTGQHYDQNMSDIFFSELEIPRPNYNLEVSKDSNENMVERMYEKLIPVIRAENPDAILLYGDTNSTLAGALAGDRLSIPAAHVEAGLRSFNMKMAEERNRIETDRLSKWRFCPSQDSLENLNKEGICDNCYVVGDVMYDATQYFSRMGLVSEATRRLAKGGDYYLATVHRAENVESPDRLRGIFDGLSKISTDARLILPLHPRTKKCIERTFGHLPDRIYFIEPVGYIDMLHLIQNSKGVFTDSGGLQKEACFLNKLCVTLRDETEWVETLEFDVNRLTGSSSNEILKAYEWMRVQTEPHFPNNIYGDGDAGDKIVHLLGKELCRSESVLSQQA